MVIPYFIGKDVLCDLDSDVWMSSRVKFIRRDKSILMKILNLFLPKDTWMTLGNRIYYPISVEDPMDKKYYDVRHHEYIHFVQFSRYGYLGVLIIYFIFPLPILFSGRWFIERKAYLWDLCFTKITINEVVNTLWKFYLFPWPKFLMKRWFEKMKEKDHRKNWDK
jgi:hypothetical protein